MSVGVGASTDFSHPQDSGNWFATYEDNLLNAVRSLDSSDHWLLVKQEIFLDAEPQVLPSIFEGERIYITPIRTLAILDAVLSGHASPEAAGILYLDQDDFSQLAKAWWRARKQGQVFALPKQLLFLNRVFNAAPPTDFRPFEAGALRTLERCIAMASGALPGILMSVRNNDAGLTHADFAASIAPYLQDC